MPSVIGAVTEEQEEAIDELVENGVYESRAEAIGFFTAYTLENKHNITTDSS